ncbi:hypothetical protein BB561_006839 [Smittium simulii]|uniref:Uncharacterized protein n=1 Tax=Smittium simulii TaxID=133385 RepID=A0A2T9Y0Y1_9FUNG|nr:hypothetical protein BB561_006839 [Smittium simulii]
MMYTKIKILQILFTVTGLAAISLGDYFGNKNLRPKATTLPIGKNLKVFNDDLIVGKKIEIQNDINVFKGNQSVQNVKSLQLNDGMHIYNGNVMIEVPEIQNLVMILNNILNNSALIEKIGTKTFTTCKKKH